MFGLYWGERLLSEMRRRNEFLFQKELISSFQINLKNVLFSLISIYSVIVQGNSSFQFYPQSFLSVFNYELECSVAVGLKENTHSLANKEFKPSCFLRIPNVGLKKQTFCEFSICREFNSRWLGTEWMKSFRSSRCSWKSCWK